MHPPLHKAMQRWWIQQLSRFIGAITFYTVIPVPTNWAIAFDGIARFAPLVGLGIGGLLALLDLGLNWLGVPQLTRSAGVVGLWVGITGGLHLDGVMDTADGLAVPDPTRRLAVMKDSATGAFGAIAGAMLLILKTTALTDLDTGRWLVLALASGWGRWGQLFAIVRYPYLRASGKGSLHKAATQSALHLLLPLLTLLGFSSLYPLTTPTATALNTVVLTLGGGAIAIGLASGFASKFGGHTGDTYGATVEWSEALFLCLAITLS